MFPDIIFLHILWITPSILLAIFLVYQSLQKSKNYNFLYLSDLEKIYKRSTPLYPIFIILLFCITLVFWLILASPVKRVETEKIKKNGIDIEIVADTSYSMIATDIQPSRIEVTKKVISEFIWEIKADRVGMILFAGKPFNSVPLTFDYDFLRDFISEVSVDTINQERRQLSGTAIGDALLLAGKTLLQKEDRGWEKGERKKIIILLTDGSANRWVDPLVALSYLKENHIKTYTIGVGKDKDTTIALIDSFWFQQHLQVGGIDEKTLKKIATETWGKYYRADSKETLEKIFSDIAKLEKKDIEVETLTLNNPQDTKFIFVLLILFGFLGVLVFHKRFEV